MVDASERLPDPVREFAQQGFLEFPQLQRHREAYALYNKIFTSRPFDQELFLTESEWEKGEKSHKQTNPRQGRNILESLEHDTRFVENDVPLRHVLSTLLGNDFRWAFKKVVCRISFENLPAWLKKLIGHKPANTLNAFIRPKFRDISYYLENDLHQDIQDYPRLPEDKRDHRILSLYVHLSDIGAQDAPLYLMPETHQFGATAYQHHIHKIDDIHWRYQDDTGHTMKTRLHPVLGPAGHIAIWHSCLIHGARPVKSGPPRLVLRYMLAGSLSNACALDRINATIQGDLFPKHDDSAGAHANSDGGWNLVDTDFTRMVP